MTDTKPLTLAEALAKLQAALPDVGKGQTANAGTYSYSYADLADCSTAIMPKLAQHGLSFSAKPTLTDDGRFVLRYVLRHTSGEDDGGDYPLPDPTKASAQQVGSAITYARRYTLCAVTGLAPHGEDDDGKAASARPDDYGRPEPAVDPRQRLWDDIEKRGHVAKLTTREIRDDFAHWAQGVKQIDGPDTTADDLTRYYHQMPKTERFKVTDSAKVKP